MGKSLNIAHWCHSKNVYNDLSPREDGCNFKDDYLKKGVKFLPKPDNKSGQVNENEKKEKNDSKKYEDRKKSIVFCWF